MLAGGPGARSQPRATTPAPEPSPEAPQSSAAGPGSFPGINQPRWKEFGEGAVGDMGQKLLGKEGVLRGGRSAPGGSGKAGMAGNVRVGG